MEGDPAQPSDSVPCRWEYDVFLSFGGEDTRYGFTGFLLDALHRKGIHTFMDRERLQRGEEISPSLVNFMEESRIFLVVFSHNYASSKWCLDELVEIVECVKRKRQMMFPIFYHVDPSDVRHQRGSYGEAFAKHMERSKYSQQKWRWALHEAANFPGFLFRHGCGYEYEFIGRIVEEVRRKINRSSSNYPVGLETRFPESESPLVAGSHFDVRIVGICGMGGIGKTTIAKALFNNILIADQFEGLSFLHDVRENSIKHGLVQLQERLLSDIFEDRSIKLGDVNHGISVAKRRLCHKKVFVVLDDVDNLEQLQAMAGGCEWFGSGSRVIITTRNKHLLDCHGVETQYEVKGLKYQEALQLLSSSASKTNVIDSSYVDALSRALLYASGLPLALKVIGSNFYGKTIDEWLSAVRKIERIPPKREREILRVSHEDLGQVKETLFLDLGSIAQPIPKRLKPVFEDTGNYSTVCGAAGVKQDIEWLSLLSSLQPLEGVNMISNPVVSNTKSDILSEKDIKLNEFREICRRIHLGKSKQTSLNWGKPGVEVCVQSKQTLVEKIHTQVLESRDNVGSVAEEADGNLISLERYMDHVDSSLNDTAVKETDAFLESDATALSYLTDAEYNAKSVNTKRSEESAKALQILRDSVSKRFSFWLGPGRSRFMKVILDYLLSLSEDDGISERMRSVMLQLSRSFTRWSRDYRAASVKLELTAADLSEVDKLEVDIKANAKKVDEVDALEDELCSLVASLQERKRELEEHIHSVTQEIVEFGLPRVSVSSEKDDFD